MTNACLILIVKEYNPKKHSWDAAKKMMGNVEAFKQSLQVKGLDLLVRVRVTQSETYNHNFTIVQVSVTKHSPHLNNKGSV